jgi:hypothetical protein
MKGTYMNRIIQMSFIAVWLMLMLHYAVPAQNNRYIHLQGTLLDTNDVTIGTVEPVTLDVHVSLFDQSAGGSACYTEDFLVSYGQGVTVNQGRFSVNLGSTRNDDQLFNAVRGHENLWVEFTVDGDVLTRTPLSSAPWALSETTDLKP